MRNLIIVILLVLLGACSMQTIQEEPVFIPVLNLSAPVSIDTDVFDNEGDVVFDIQNGTVGTDAVVFYRLLNTPLDNDKILYTRFNEYGVTIATESTFISVSDFPSIPASYGIESYKSYFTGTDIWTVVSITNNLALPDMRKTTYLVVHDQSLNITYGPVVIDSFNGYEHPNGLNGINWNSNIASITSDGSSILVAVGMSYSLNYSDAIYKYVLYDITNKTISGSGDLFDVSIKNSISYFDIKNIGSQYGMTFIDWDESNSYYRIYNSSMVATTGNIMVWDAIFSNRSYTLLTNVLSTGNSIVINNYHSGDDIIKIQQYDSSGNTINSSIEIMHDTYARIINSFVIDDRIVLLYESGLLVDDKTNNYIIFDKDGVIYDTDKIALDCNRSNGFLFDADTIMMSYNNDATNNGEFTIYNYE